MTFGSRPKLPPIYFQWKSRDRPRKVRDTWQPELVAYREANPILFIYMGNCEEQRQHVALENETI